MGANGLVFDIFLVPPLFISLFSSFVSISFDVSDSWLNRKVCSSNMGMIRMNDLPYDISLNIFSRLDADSVLDCKLVCKPWLNLIKNPSFVQTHLAHHKLLFQTLDYACESVDLGFLLLEKIQGKPNDCKLRYVEYKVDANKKKSYQMKNKTIHIPPIKQKFCVDVAVVGSCNGLICSTVRHDELYDPIHICNPVTREYVYLPRYEKENGSQRVSAMAGGFGYCHSTDEYKVVRIYLKGIHCFFQVYRLGKESICKWTEEKEIPELLVASIDHSKSVVVNGEIHWLDLDSRIVAFSLEDEEFRVIALPPPLARGSSSYHDKKTLCLLGDWLCLVHCTSSFTREGNKHHVEIWLLKENMQQNGTWFWNKELSVQVESRNVIPLAISNNGKILFWEGVRFVSYDPKDGVREKLSWDHDHRASLEVYEATRHVNSFVSLKALGVKNCRRRLQYKGK